MIQLAGGRSSQLCDSVRDQSGRQRTYRSSLPIRGDKANYLWVIAAHVCFSGFSTPIESSQDSRPLLLAGLHPPPGQSGMQGFISWLGCFLTEIERGRWSSPSYTCISPTQCSHPDEQSRLYWGWGTSTAFGHGQRGSGFTGVSVPALLQTCPSLQSVTSSQIFLCTPRDS